MPETITGRSLKHELPWIAAVLELLLLVLLIQVFRLEGAAFAGVAWLLWGGFVIQHWLPSGWKLSFFILLSIAALVVEAGAGAGWVLAFGAALIGICHLPLHVGIRSFLLIVVGLLLAWMRIVSPAASWQPQGVVWPILGSMFMFRLLAYVYDREHDPKLGSPQLAAAYFFMLPNASFPLYPPIDYRTFCGSYASARNPELYQSGLKWIGRGLLQLVLYRAVLHYGYLAVEDVRTLSDVARHVVMTYLLYLRISGQFHLIVGILHLFGFNLPETHHRYLLASSFTDFWRRINIYWRDYLTRYFFYPIYFRIKSWGPLKSLTVATLVTFAVTWILHSYQWFWLRGRFVLTWQDTLFWWALAGLVLFNAIQEARRGRVRTLKPRRPTARDNLVLAAKTIAVFVTISGLWTIWSCRSLLELRWLAQRSLVFDLWDLLLIGAGMLVLGVAAVRWGRTAREHAAAPAMTVAPTAAGALPEFNWTSWRWAMTSLATLLLISQLPGLAAARDSNWGHALHALITNRRSAGEIEQQERGYYEQLTQESDASPLNACEAGWTTITRELPGPLRYDMHPSQRFAFEDLRLTTNSLGFRDQEYELDKPAQCCRLVILGSSHEMGAQVSDEVVFDRLVEDQMNRLMAGGDFAPFRSFELVNMSVKGYGIQQKLLMLEERALPMQPDAILFFTYPEEFSRTSERIESTVRAGDRLPYARLQDVLDKHNLQAGLDDVALRAYAKDCREDFVAQAFIVLAEISRNRNIPCFVVYRPTTTLEINRDPSRDLLFRFIEASQLPLVNLDRAYDSVDDRLEITVSPFDGHPNRKGHALLAESLLAEIRATVLPALLKADSASETSVTDAVPGQ